MPLNSALQEPPAAGRSMKKISTPYSWSMKAFPFFFFGFLAFMLALMMMNGALGAPMFLLTLVAISVIGYFYWKVSLRDIMDEVYDCGDFLVLKKRCEEDTVLLSNINNVRFSTDRRGVSARITLSLDSPGKFGQEVSFAPPPQIYFGAPKNEIAADLLDRARSGRPASRASSETQ